jgi:hypothetical protein
MTRDSDIDRDCVSIFGSVIVPVLAGVQDAGQGGQDVPG